MRYSRRVYALITEYRGGRTRFQMYPNGRILVALFRNLDAAQLQASWCWHSWANPDKQWWKLRPTPRLDFVQTGDHRWVSEPLAGPKTRVLTFQIERYWNDRTNPYDGEMTYAHAGVDMDRRGLWAPWT